MGDLSSGDYHLSVSGVGPSLEFKNITALRFEPKSYSVFIETDRAIYKPGDLVQFRVIVVNPNLRPSVTGAIDVHVEVKLLRFTLYLQQTTGTLQYFILSRMIY